MSMASRESSAHFGGGGDGRLGLRPLFMGLQSSRAGSLVGGSVLAGIGGMFSRLISSAKNKIAISFLKHTGAAVKFKTYQI